jgi:predicted nucleic acid-binding protein
LIAVLDASAFGPILLAEEAGRVLPGLSAALADEGMAVPAHWQIEVANLLLMAVRRGRLPPEEAEQAFRTFEAVRIEIDVSPLDRVIGETWVIAERHMLTMYDAGYLELAIRLDLPLATHDAALIRAAKAESLPLFGQ